MKVGHPPISCLLVEDDAAYGRLVQELLRFARGPRLMLSRVSRLSEALSALDKGGFDVVLLDLTLPDATGVEMIGTVQVAAPEVPVVVLTGLDDEALAVRAMREGAQDYLVKGHFDGDLLVRAVRYAIERRRSQTETRRSEARLATVIERLPEGVLLLDDEGRLVHANGRGLEYLPRLLDHAAAVGDVLVDFGLVTLEELLVAPAEGDWHELMGGAAADWIAEVRAWAVPVGARGTGSLVVIRDVTEVRRVHEYVETQQRLAAVGELAAGIAHDFNNVLQVIIGAADLLQNAPELTRDSQERAAFIARQGQHAARVIQQILAFSRRSLLERRQLDLGDFVREVVDVLRHVIPEHIEVRLEIEPGEYPAKADPTQLNQVIANLAVNARDAMESGGVLTIGLEQLAVPEDGTPPLAALRPGAWCVLRVEDTGLGMEPDVLARVFEPFFTTKEVGKGTGLGLSQVYGSVSQHEGFVDVASKVGRGTTFRVFLPLISDGSSGTHVVPGAYADSRPKGRTVLVVEDEEDVRIMLADILAFLGYDVLTASNGVEAIEIHTAHRDRIGIVLTDMTMPEMGGVELADLLHADSPALKVLVVTGYPLGADADVLSHAAICGWVQKPIEIDHLAAVLAEALGEQERTRTPPAETRH